MPPPRLRLLTRNGCVLCQHMADDLSRLQVGFDTIDIESDAALEQAYGEAIPVLMLGDVEIARAPQDRASLQRTLKQAGLL